MGASPDHGSGASGAASAAGTPSSLRRRLSRAGMSAGAAPSTADGGSGARGFGAGGDATDARFERAILLLQAHALKQGWRHTLAGSWGNYIHLVVSVPDTAVQPILQFLSAGLGAVLGTAGLAGWSFPMGCVSPEVVFKVERYLSFNRRERAVSERGVGWVRLYPRRVGGFDDVMREVAGFLASYDVPAAAAGGAGGAAASAPAGVGPTEGAASPTARPVVDVFGDAVTLGSDSALTGGAAPMSSPATSGSSRQRRRGGGGGGGSATTFDSDEEGSNVEDDGM
jgi:hypothetical protein